MNIASNPWSFVQADIKAATATASPNGLVMSGTGPTVIVTLTTTGAHGYTVGQYITVLADGGTAAYQGCYRVEAVPSATTATLIPVSGAVTQATSILSGGGGNAVNLCLYNQMCRFEDIQWEKPAAGETLDLRDRNGNVLWQATYPAASTAPNWNRGKLFWVNGFTPVSISTGGTGVVIVTVN